MNRWYLVMLATIALGVTLWLRSDKESLVGEWRAKTSQELPLQFHISDTGDGLVIDEWSLNLDLTCERTGVVLHGLLSSTIPVRIHDQSFRTQIAAPRFWQRWSGSFATGTRSTGELGAVWPALTGTRLEELGTQKCTALDISWEAERSGERGDAWAKDPDFAISIESDGTMRVTLSRTR